MKKTLVLTLALSLSAPLTALAQDGSVIFSQEHFNQLDVNQDGRVSETEYRQFMEGAFEQLDTNGDNQLSQAEANAALGADHFSAADADSNGYLSRQEFLSQVMRDFQEADRDNNGYLTYP